MEGARVARPTSEETVLRQSLGTGGWPARRELAASSAVGQPVHDPALRVSAVTQVGQVARPLPAARSSAGVRHAPAADGDGGRGSGRVEAPQGSYAGSRR